MHNPKACAAAFLGAVLAGWTSGADASDLPRSSLTLFDEARQRPVPVELYLPADGAGCTSTQPCPVAILGSGYGISNGSYSFLADALGANGFLTVAVQHELPSDPPLATSGDLFAGRIPNWERGADNLRFVMQTLEQFHPGFDWSRPVLIGHSNGGDIATWFVQASPSFAGRLVTLDNRRVPLPRGSSSPRMLSVRASDLQADEGVLPDPDELEVAGSCVVWVNGARHNDMHDGGPEELKAAIANAVVPFLRGERCESLLPAAVAPPAPDRRGSP